MLPITLDDGDDEVEALIYQHVSGKADLHANYCAFSRERVGGLIAPRESRQIVEGRSETGLVIGT
jgi:hypothetical protein